MCDPVTMGLAAGAISGGGAYALGGSALLGGATVSVGTALGIGATVGSTVMQMGSQYQSAKYDQARFRNQELGYAREEKERALKQKIDENIRKESYYKDLSTRKAQMGASGIEIGSKSFSNILLKDRNTYLQDMDAIGLSGMEQKLSLLEQRKEAKLSYDSIDPTANMVAAGLTGASRLSGQLKEISGKPPTTSTNTKKSRKNVSFRKGTLKGYTPPNQFNLNEYGY